MLFRRVRVFEQILTIKSKPKVSHADAAVNARYHQRHKRESLVKLQNVLNYVLVKRQ